MQFEFLKMKQLDKDSLKKSSKILDTVRKRIYDNDS
jgi:hypothetical protein